MSLAEQIPSDAPQQPAGIQASDEELLEVRHAIDRERQWLEGLRVYSTVDDMKSAFESGELVEVEENDNVRPILSIATDRPGRESFPYVLPETRLAIIEFAAAWREMATSKDVPPEVKLALSSLGRPTTYQEKLRAQGKLAVKDSSHEKGAAFDVPVADYYIVKDGQVTSVSLRNPARAQEFRAAYLAQGAPPVDIQHLGPEHYDPRVAKALKEVAAEWHEQDLLNAVPEFAATRPDNEIIHFCVNVPRFRQQ